MTSANKVVLNTGILYGRMVVTMGISLYTTRLVLASLGSVDYGIFNLVAGLIAMLAFLNSAMATSTQRFLSYYQGKNDFNTQRKVFGNSLILHFFIGCSLVVIMELVGLFLFDGFLNIPAVRMGAGKTIYHFMSATVFFTVVSVPFIGSLVAHENMGWVAIVSFIEAFLKLGIAHSLTFVTNDRLVTYGLLTSGVCVVSFILYAGFCIIRYRECLIGRGMWDQEIMRKLGGFAGWNLFGSLCVVSRNQGTAILLNLFHGTVINAAYGIANQVSAQLGFFSATLIRAVNPQIVKSEGAGNRERMLKISLMASKFGFFLLAALAVPCIFEIDFILAIWLQKVPESTAIFCSLILLASMFNQLTIGLQSAIQATGRIKIYQSVVGGVLLLNLPIAYALLYTDCPVHLVILTFSAVEFCACICRVLLLKKLAGMSITRYISKVILREIFPLAILLSLCYGYTTLPSNFERVILTFMTSFTLFPITIYFFGLEPDEKNLLMDLLSKVRTRLFNREKLDTAI